VCRNLLRGSPRIGLAIDSPCECEHNNPDSLDARLFFTVVLAVAPAVTIDEASSLSWYLWAEREDASSMVTAASLSLGGVFGFDTDIDE